ncbi:MAG: hypothetical protein EPO68_14390 [Planctomycetota bacterium]|nr:MAG: hypothetical protein EPO68_14390 [Planctomycetota bacterium]
MNVRAAFALLVCALAACATRPAGAPRPAEPAPALLREPTRALVIERRELALDELLGAWTDCGGPDVVVVGTEARTRVAAARVELGAGAAIAADALTPVVERALLAHELVLRAAPGRPAALVAVELAAGSHARGSLAPLTLGPEELERAARHAALLVRLVVPVGARDPATMRDSYLLDGRERAHVAFAPGCVVVEGPAREAADVGRQLAALLSGPPQVFTRP